MTNADLINKLRDPVDWAHFVNDDHAQDYAEFMRLLADRLETCERQSIEYVHTINKLKLTIARLERRK